MTIRISVWDEQEGKDPWRHQRDEEVDAAIIKTILDKGFTQVMQQYRIEIPELEKTIYTVNPFLFEQKI